MWTGIGSAFTSITRNLAVAQAGDLHAGNKIMFSNTILSACDEMDLLLNLQLHNGLIKVSCHWHWALNTEELTNMYVCTPPQTSRC
jgi:hypothetical protein